ncbi:Hypothetical predicted protein, partial [Mytilus galloprovincialis]
MKKMAAIYRQLIVLSVTWTIVDSFTEPTPNVSNLTLSAQIFTDGTCNDVDCYRTYCAGRSSTVNPENITKTIPLDICKPTITGPPNGDTAKGHVTFDSNNYVNCSVSKSYSPSLPEYTLTFWIKYDCTGSSDCSVKINSSIKVEFKSNQMTVNGESYTCQSNAWKFIVLKKNSVRSVIYIDDVRQSVIPQLPVLSQINIDPSNMNAGDSFTLLDVRLYRDPLTEREITQIYNKLTEIEDVKPYSDCRCPSLHPIVHSDNNYYSLQCKNEGGDIVSRFKPNSVIHYIADNSETTYWNTTIKQTEFTIQLDQIYQIDEIELVTTTTPCNVNFTLDSGNTKVVRGLTRTKWSNVSQNINSRSQYEDVITRNITVQLSGFCNGNSHAIAEFKVTGRCSCYGNSGSCTYHSSPGLNICQCQNNTRDSDCSQCKVGYYRSEEDFGCHQSCQCNADGTSGSTQICDQ